MNIQIFGTRKCFDTKKAERWFKERRIKFQAVDLNRQGMSLEELNSVRQAVGLEAMVDPSLLRTPVVRNGKQATVGYCPEVWEGWT